MSAYHAPASAPAPGGMGKDYSQPATPLADETKGHDAYLPASGMKDIPEEQEMSFNSILKGTAANRLSLFEKKAALINE